MSRQIDVSYDLKTQKTNETHKSTKTGELQVKTGELQVKTVNNEGHTDDKVGSYPWVSVLIVLTGILILVVVNNSWLTYSQDNSK